MRKISTTLTSGKNLFQGQLTIGLDLGDRSSAYCVLDGTGEILLVQKVAMTPEPMRQAFEKMPRCRIAMETGTHSPWVSRLLTALGHEVIVAHAQRVRLIAKSRRKDDRVDARTLARGRLCPDGDRRTNVRDMVSTGRRLLQLGHGRASSPGMDS